MRLLLARTSTYIPRVNNPAVVWSMNVDRRWSITGGEYIRVPLWFHVFGRVLTCEILYFMREFLDRLGKIMVAKPVRVEQPLDQVDDRHFLLCCCIGVSVNRKRAWQRELCQMTDAFVWRCLLSVLLMEMMWCSFPYGVSCWEKMCEYYGARWLVNTLVRLFALLPTASVSSSWWRPSRADILRVP